MVAVIDELKARNRELLLLFPQGTARITTHARRQEVQGIVWRHLLSLAVALVVFSFHNMDE